MPEGVDALSLKDENKRNRGRYLEEWIDLANQYYAQKGLAVIQKIPTPWIVVRKYSPYTKSYRIANAFPEKKSSVDFGGTASNRSIWFDAKATKLKNNFPLKNIHKHQIEYLRNVYNQGGKAFLLIHSEVENKTWLLWISQLLAFLESETRKSIPFSWFDEHCAVIRPKDGILLDYLPEALREGR